MEWRPIKWYEKSLEDYFYDVLDGIAMVIAWCMKTFIPKKILRKMIVKHYAKQKPEVVKPKKEDLRT